MPQCLTPGDGRLALYSEEGEGSKHWRMATTKIESELDAQTRRDYMHWRMSVYMFVYS